MRGFKRIAAGVLAAAVCCAGAFGLTTTATAATADETTCRGTIGARSIDGDVRVPSGATCNLTGTVVDGNVKVYSGATLVANRARIGGSVQAENARKVTVAGGRVDGSIQLKQGRGPISLSGVTLGSDIQLFSNVGRSVVSRNVVDGNLQCKSNRPQPGGGGNRVQGNKEDQCARL